MDQLLSSLDKSDSEVDALWAKEAESRIDAYQKGKLGAISLEKVLEKYNCLYVAFKNVGFRSSTPTDLTVNVFFNPEGM